MRLLAKIDHESAVDAAEAQQARREATRVRMRDGGLRINAQLYGLDAEYAATGFHAWRRPDWPGEHRTRGQRSADAIVDMCRASVTGRSDITHRDHNAGGIATSGGAAAEATLAKQLPPTRHGVRPHVVVTVDLETLLTGHGTAETE